MFTEAVEEREEEEDVTDSLLGESGDRLRPRSFSDNETFPVVISSTGQRGVRQEL